jgi:hypothetical protein
MKRSRLHRGLHKVKSHRMNFVEVEWENAIPPMKGMHGIVVGKGEAKKKGNILSVLRMKRDYHKEKVGFYNMEIKELKKL